MIRNLIRLAVAAITAMVLLVVPAAPGRAQPPFFPGDSCIGIDHFPDDPIGNAPSAVNFLFSIDPSLAGNDVMIMIDGSSGPQTGVGTIDSDGVGQVRAPLFSFGPHQITDLYINPGGVMGDIDFSGFGDNGAFVVDDAENVCDPSGLSLVKGTTSTTTAPTTTTTVAETTTTVEETTTTVPETTTTVEETTTTFESSPPTSIQITDPETGTTYTAWWWIGGAILLVVGGGVFFLAREGDPCIHLKGRWMQAKKACDEARAELEERKKSLNEALDGLKAASKEKKEWEDGVQELEEELASLERSRNTSAGTGGVTFHRIREGMVTSEGLESIIESVKRQLDSRRENVGSWDQSINEWKDRVKTHEKLVAAAQARVNELCAEAEKARKAYEDCIKPKPKPAPTPVGGGEPGTVGGATGGGGGTAPPTGPTGPSGPGGPTGPSDPGDQPDDTPSECKDGDTEEEEIERKTFTVGRNAGSLTLSIDPPTDEYQEWMTETLSQTGRLSPTYLLDPAFPGRIKDMLSGLDTGLGVAHRVEIRIPRQRVTYACIQHRRCQGGQWVDTYRETRHISSERVGDEVITSDQLGPKLSSADVYRLIRQAATRYGRLVKADEEIEKLCQ